VIIRKYQNEDTDEIIQLFYDTVHQINIRDYSQKQINAWAPKNMTSINWVNRLSDKITYVAEENIAENITENKTKKILGFAQLETSGHIDCFYCHHQYQGIGIGSRLLNQIELTALNLGIKRLFTEASITAKPFFENKGFSLVNPQEVECRGEIFINYVMKKDLK
jgi:putative acetyltransferase